ncbi:heavy-metal-associated domain-containing protein [Gallibacterium genomosp. 3]|uniref:Mercuric reductase n=1 Tax=Gallibacterium genomosp. 3 TaxID=505345 RepID=A0A1A7PZM8_9PAST|nr:heavy-metal-associated domain-containing protein [Gallibacterium genomosp. 3]OBX07236.1 mercuric reductase [Gallibacterium genomosp. 3]
MKKIIYVLLMTSVFSQAVYAAAQPQLTSQTVEREVSFYVKEMTCQLCVYLVNKELRSLDGVIKTKANMNEHTVKVIAKPEVTNQQLIQAIEKLHYTAKVIE